MPKRSVWLTAGASLCWHRAVNYIVRGYDDRDRIVYGSGRISETSAIAAEVGKMFEDPGITYAHVRSATNNCYQCRIERA